MKQHRINTILETLRKQLRRRQAHPRGGPGRNRDWIEKIQVSAEGKKKDVQGRLAKDVIRRILGVADPDSGIDLSAIPQGQETAESPPTDFGKDDMFIYDSMGTDNRRIRKNVRMSGKEHWILPGEKADKEKEELDTEFILDEKVKNGRP
jgi:hypothetical protein